MLPVFEDIKVNLRPLEAGDIDQISEIESSVQKDPWSRNLILESLTAPMTYTLGVFGDRGCLAYSVSQVIFTEGHLLNLAVAKDFQRKGIGRALLEEVMQMLREHGAASIFLEVRPSNFGGKKLYESAGFRELALRDNYYSNGEAAVVMICDRF